jgi:hypothetical protein
LDRTAYFSLIITLVIGGLALSGKFSVTATQILFLMAWVAAIIALRSKSLFIITPMACALGCALLLLAFYFRPDVIPQYVGAITPQRKVPFSSSSDENRPTIQIGDGSTYLVWNGPRGTPVLKFFGESELIIETIRNEVKVTTTIRDEHGNIVAELVRNEWRVAPPPNTFDRNYNAHSLEVRNARGQIVLQVTSLPDRIQLQGEWWSKSGAGFRLVALRNHGQGVIIQRPHELLTDDLEIQPMFEYPSDRHFGELKK